MTQNKVMNKIIAITGGIGSGKSTALEILNKLGYKSFNADIIYKDLLLNEDFTLEISRALSVEPILIGGRLTLDRKAVAALVFKDESALNKLNSITHPLIMKEMIKRAKECDGLVFCEVPLLFEGGYENLFDCVFVVKRNNGKRFESVVKRDGKSLEQVKSIAQKQFDYNKISQNEHTFIIENDGDEIRLAEKLKVAIQQIEN